MRRQMGKPPAAEEGAIDLTPMLDVVFIMLIFFIVTATFIKEAGVDINRVVAVTANNANASILIAVSENSEIWMDKKKLDARALKTNVERVRAENPEGGVVIQADAEATADVIAEVMDAVRDAGVVDVVLSTDK